MPTTIVQTAQVRAQYTSLVLYTLHSNTEITIDEGHLSFIEVTRPEASYSESLAIIGYQKALDSLPYYHNHWHTRHVLLYHPRGHWLVDCG